MDRAGVIHAPVGKVSFGAEKLLQNLAALMDALVRLKPDHRKGTYMKGIHLSHHHGSGDSGGHQRREESGEHAVKEIRGA